MWDYYEQLHAKNTPGRNDQILRHEHSHRLIQEETENNNRLITSTEIETVIKNLPIKKNVFTGEFYQTFREEWTYIFLKLSPPPNTKGRGRNPPKLILRGQHHPVVGTLDLHLEEDRCSTGLTL